MNQVQRWQKSDTIITVVLVIGMVLSRWPFQTILFSDHQAVNYALALYTADLFASAMVGWLSCRLAGSSECSFSGQEYCP
jgi:hypothetical protein